MSFSSRRTALPMLLARALGVIALALAVAAFTASASVVETSDGPVRGAAAGGVVSFKGIPYAAPPVGELRWRAPQPPDKWSEPRDATRYGKACIQDPNIPSQNGGVLGEDCLTLNVWTEKLDASVRRPVLVWIHGGAFIIGGSGIPLYDGARLARQGVVFVSMNYRLGPLGFFAHPALERERPGGPVNFGLFDQLAALKWVKTNIARFGGDPDNVTIMGQSAGARSVLVHMASPLSRGLFQKALVESTYADPELKLEEARTVGAAVATAVGLKGADATLEELRAVPATRFGTITNPKAETGAVAIAGDEIVPRDVAEVFAAGGEAPVPLVIGTTSDDSSVLLDVGIKPEKAFKVFGAAGIDLKSYYAGVKGEASLGRKALRDMVFTLNARRLAHQHARLASTWRYYFAYVASEDRKRFLHGVPHCGGIPFFLDTLTGSGFAKAYTKKDRAVAREASARVVAFAKTGRPDIADAPDWSADTPSADATLEFGSSGSLVLQKDFMKTRLDAFDAHRDLIAKILAD